MDFDESAGGDFLKKSLMQDVLGMNFGHRIIVCTTLRDFGVSAINDKIQGKFLDSLSNQTHKNWRLVVTTFGEKNVRPVVERKLGDKCSFVEEPVPDEGLLYSHTSVLLNGIAAAKEGDVVFWCVGDIQLPPQYFEAVSALYIENLVGTTHPRFYAESFKELDSGRFLIGHPLSSFDFFFLTGSLLKEERILDIIRQYRFYGWGGFDLFLVALAARFFPNRVNLANRFNYMKFKSDRGTKLEQAEFMTRCDERNSELLNEAAKGLGIDPGVFSGKMPWPHMQFRLLYPDQRRRA